MVVEPIPRMKVGAFEQLISSTDVAKRAGVDKETARRWLRRGKLTGTKVGHTWLVAEMDFKAFMDERNHTDLDS